MMKMAALLLFSLTLFLLAGTAQANTFNLYETTGNTSTITATSTACEACPIQLPGFAESIPGWAILMESGDPTNPIDQANTLLWGDAVRIHGGGEVPAIQIFSDGCDTGIEGDMTCFPTYPAVISMANMFVLETAPPTVVNWFNENTYNVFSDAPETAAVAEPGSLLLLGSGLAGLGAFARRIRQRL